MKKLLAVLLSLCLVVGMLPVMAFADGEGDTEGGTQIIEPLNGEDGASGPSNPDAKNTNAVNPNAYNPKSINSLDELKNALNAKEKELTLGLNIELTGELEIGYDVTINGHNGTGFTGEGTLKIASGADVQFKGVKLGTDMEVAKGATITFDASCSAAEGIAISAQEEGAVTGAPSNVTVDLPTKPPVVNPPIEEPEPDPVVYYTVKFNVKPYWATVTVKDDQGKSVTVSNNRVTLEKDKTYTYTVEAPGFEKVSYSFTATKDYTYTVELDLATDLLVWPYSHGSVWTEELSRGWVAVHVEPDSGYYLDDLTIYKVGYGAIDYGRWDGGVYYFRMAPGEQYIVDADFAAAPSEYRVYIDSGIKHGSVTADTVYAEEGEWVYITAKPDVGYKLYTLTVTRPSGNTVKVEHVRDNVYRFAMPGVRVTVDAEFIRTVTPFTDVHLADWFYEYVSFAYRYGLMEGINSYQFAPDASTTRAMVVQILYRMSGEPYVSYSSGFTDVASNAWYSDAIAWAARNNIVNGTSATTFDPNAPVTREQFATMLYRYANYRGFKTSVSANILSYYDVGQVSEYAFPGLEWACAQGIVNGTSTGYLSPQGNATRAQLAAMLMRFCTIYFEL